MSLLGLELSDAGIMAAVASDPPGLLQIDQGERESPGCAFQEHNRLVVGREAETRAHLDPRQVTNWFWDQLSGEPLKQGGLESAAQNHAEVAYAHLTQIWDKIKAHGDEVIIAVPGFYNSDQLGLILGMAADLSMPVKGFIDLAVAAARETHPESALIHVDIHLHRSVVTFLEQTNLLTRQDVATAAGKGLIYLQTEWVKGIADEFVRTTRFDPLHQAASEQELYDRLPGIMATLQQSPFVTFELAAAAKTHRVTLSRDLFVEKSELVSSEVRRLIADMRARYAKPKAPLTLQLTHRITRLPGWKEMLAEIPAVKLIELKPGAAALGALRLWDQLSTQVSDGGVALFSSRPWQPAYQPPAAKDQAASSEPPGVTRPTHVLYRNLAYPISDQPLTIGTGSISDGVQLQLWDDAADISRKHCTLELRGDNVVLIDHSDFGTLVDETPVSGSAVLRVGQTIRVGTSGEDLLLIASTETNAT
jgi:hypothetical protein